MSDNMYQVRAFVHALNWPKFCLLEILHAK